MRYLVKCDECKTKIAETDSQTISAAGGWCDPCRAKFTRQERAIRYRKRADAQFARAQTGEVIDLTELMIRAGNV